MKIRIYQIDFTHDEKMLSFLSLEAVMRKCGGSIPAECYRMVYACETSAETLEDVFYIFNEKRPEDYRSRSMSVSDVVEVLREDASSLFYFCDVIGFKAIDFDAVKVIGGAQNGM